MKKQNTKYIFVVGGVMSGVGKGITTSSTALILKEYGYKVSAIKADPYLNIDAGTMNPTEHGEVFVLSDGDECDQDMGNYERFLNTDLKRDNYITSGRIYEAVLKKERSLGYGGKCVQPIPHITEEIINRIENVGKKSEIVLIEIGGTIGEYENQLFLEAARIMKNKYTDHVMTMLVSYAPKPSTIGEMKTKPTQHASRLLNERGLQADIIILRSEEPADHIRKEKLSMFCNINAENIISAPDIKSIYDVPINFEKDKLGSRIIKILKLKPHNQEYKDNNTINKNNQTKVKNNKLQNNKSQNNKDIESQNYNPNILKEWKKFFAYSSSEKKVKVAMICKYINSGNFVLSDAYISVIESLKYACYKNKRALDLYMINSESLEKDKSKINNLKDFDAILIPGGFGSRGIEGKILAIKYARENNIPILGICYGMQLMTIEYARNVLNIKDATSSEINTNSKNKIVDIIKSQKENLNANNMGNSMRLGNCESLIKKNTLAYKIYNKENIIERHRHRYEINPEYYEILNSKDLQISAYSKSEGLAEIIEIKKHKFFVGVQFHPELLSRPLNPHPLFDQLIKAATQI